MLVNVSLNFFRLSFNKCEQEKEETLLELLDHLLDSQAHGRSAEDVFGNNPKQYMNELIGELPKTWTRRNVSAVLWIASIFLTAYLIGGQALNGIIFLIFGISSGVKEVFVGSALLITVFAFVVSMIQMSFIIKTIRWACFRRLKKWKEFLLYWLFGVLGIGIIVLFTYLLPDIGPAISIPYYVNIAAGLLFLLLSFLFRRQVG
ncbi:Protein of unknown function [Shouchella lonarensis]|uniref:Uncharacterized protein n=1 Tax=Shouchella lonarensis TaxID=1464122 RepID=A0A1G6GPL9_9BACI|nr:Protein of unknown function [Shouchella lonarensis]